MAIQASTVYQDVDAAVEGIVAEYNSHPENETFRVVAVIGQATFTLIHSDGRNILNYSSPEAASKADLICIRIKKKGIGSRYGQALFITEFVQRNSRSFSTSPHSKHRRRRK